MDAGDTHDRPGSADAGLRLEHSASGAALLDAAGPYLVAREAEHSRLLGIVGAERDRPDTFGGSYLALVRDAGAVALVAAWTPEHPLVLSVARRPEAVDLVAADILRRPARPPGVVGPVDAARRFVATWLAAGGPAATLEMRTRTYRLDAVVPQARPAEGVARAANHADVAAVAAWLAAFEAEAVPHETPDDAPQDVVARWIADPGRIVWIWVAGGRPVSMALAGNRTPNGRRIGVVYTPPEHRRRGYAGALVAAASQAELDAGRSFVFLDTDLANPTSNRVYEALGYRGVIDGESYGFAAG